MTRTLTRGFALSIACGAVAVACSAQPAGTTGGAPGSSTAQTALCAAYVGCIGVIDRSQLADTLDAYGPDGNCWASTADVASKCDAACRAGLQSALVTATGDGAAAPPECVGDMPAPCLDVLSCAPSSAADTISYAGPDGAYRDGGSETAREDFCRCELQSHCGDDNGCAWCPTCAGVLGRGGVPCQGPDADRYAALTACACNAGAACEADCKYFLCQGRGLVANKACDDCVQQRCADELSACDGGPSADVCTCGT